MTSKTGPQHPRPGTLVEKARWTPQFLVGIVIVALAAAGFAIAFRASLALVWRTAIGARDVVEAMTAVDWWVRLVLPALGGLVAGWLVILASRRPGAHGVGGVMEAVALGRVGLSLPVAVIRAAASWFAIASGGSLGREGPLIQFGGAAGYEVGVRLGLSLHERRVLVAAGTAAGFGAAYNTPFAAVAFVLEVVTGIIVIDSVVPTLMATVIATAATRAVVGEGPIYGVRTFLPGDLRELAAFAVVGAACAVGAWSFTQLNAYAERGFRKIKPPWRHALGGLGAGAVIVWMPQVAGNGYEPLDQMLDGKLALVLVGWLLIAKTLATTSSVAAGNPGGVFTPSMLLGGCTGYVIGAGLDAAGFATSSAGAYALVGMAAAVAATTHAPLTAALLAFEVSGDYAVVLPLVLAVAVATALARKLGRDSVYTRELRKRGISWELTMAGREVAVDDAPKPDK
jgi:CIC family chloride channel protein